MLTTLTRVAALIVCTVPLAPAYAQEADPAPVPAPVPAPAPAPDAAELTSATWPDFIPLPDAEGRDLAPYGYRRARKATTGLVITGASLFGGAYLLSGAIGALGTDIEGNSEAAWMFVPVVGPIGWASTSGGTGVGTYLLGVDAVTQATGVVLFALGMHGRDGWERKPPSLLFVPTARVDGGGLQAIGTF